MNFPGNSFLAVAVLTFVSIALLLEGLYLLWRAHRSPEARRLRRRLLAIQDPGDPAAASVLKRRLLAERGPLERMALRLPKSEALDHLLLQSGLPWTMGRLLLLSILHGAALLVAALLLRAAPVAAVAAGAGGAAVPALYALWQRERRMRRLEQQIPDALDLIGRSLRAGHSFPATLKLAGEELPDPMAAEFRTLHDEVNLGLSMPQALANLATRVPSTDLRYFVVAVLIQREAGGNLSEVLRNLAGLIRNRLKLKARIRVLSAEGRLSAWILVITPFALGGLLSLANPQFMQRLWTDPIGISMLQAMLGLMLVGVLLLRKIVRIRV